MEKILSILKELHPEVDFTASTSFLEDELLDSFDIVSIISEIEAQFGCVVDGLEVLPENFESLESIKQLIIRSGGQVE